MLTVWKLKNQSVALRRGKHNATKGLGQTPHQQKGTWLQLPYYVLLRLIELIRHSKA